MQLSGGAVLQGRDWALLIDVQLQFLWKTGRWEFWALGSYTHLDTVEEETTYRDSLSLWKSQAVLFDAYD